MKLNGNFSLFLFLFVLLEVAAFVVFLGWLTEPPECETPGCSNYALGDMGPRLSPLCTDCRWVEFQVFREQMEARERLVEAGKLPPLPHHPEEAAHAIREWLAKGKNEGESNSIILPHR